MLMMVPTLGIVKRAVLFLVAGPNMSAMDGIALYFAEEDMMLMFGVNVAWEKLFTADPAGFNEIEPRSPPSAVKAFPIEMLRAVP